MGKRGSKDKATGAQGGAHSGLGRLRRANAKKNTRLRDLRRHSEDEDFLAQHEGTARTAHTGASLLAKFNRLSDRLQDVEHDQHWRQAEVCGFQGTLITVRLADDSEHPCQIRRRLKKMLSGEKSPLAIGDAVAVSKQDEGDLVIETILPRRNQLQRRDSHNASLSHVFAANIDRLVIVAALRDPILKTGLIDRYLLIAALADVPASIVFNKIDLADGAPIRQLYAHLGYPTFATNAEDGAGDIAALRQHLAGHACVFAGQSGVGKSSLINALYPQFAARVGSVSAVLHKGRHTTTSARSYLLDQQTRLIDTPGIRELGVQLQSAMDAALRYPEIAAEQPACHFPDCSHTHEPNCAVKEAVHAGRIALSRYGSYVALLSNDLGMVTSACSDLVGDLTKYSGDEEET